MNLPGQRIGLTYVWVIVLSPMILFLSGTALLVVGLWRNVDSVAVIGAIAIVTSFVLPRMHGRFRLGPGGIEGDLENDVFRAVIAKALEQGLPPEDALELASGASEATGPGVAASMAENFVVSRPVGASEATALPHLHVDLRQTGAPVVWGSPRSRLVQVLADQTVGQGVRLEQETAAIVERVAAERGWAVERDAHFPRTGGHQRVDFAIATPSGQVLIENALSMSPRLLQNKIDALAGLVRHLERVRAFVVLPGAFPVQRL